MLGGTRTSPMSRQAPPQRPQGAPPVNQLIPLPEPPTGGMDDEAARRQRLVDALRGGGGDGGSGWGRLGRGMGEMFAQWMKRPGGDGVAAQSPPPRGAPIVSGAGLGAPNVVGSGMIGPGVGGLY